VARDEREREWREAGIAERVARLREEPALVLNRLAETRSVWNAADIERAVRSMLGARDGYDTAVGVATQAITQASLTLDVDAFTLERVVVEERAVFDAAATLSERRRDVGLRPPSAELDTQQQSAYAHLAGERDLAIVTGIAGAGKSRLQRDVAVAYEEAGFRVIGAAIAGDAARTRRRSGH
jgi:hypothetical protein